MIFDDVDFDQLPEGSEEAFIAYEKQIRNNLNKLNIFDRGLPDNQDQNGYYSGDYTPERSYITAIMAFIDEYDLDIDFPDISSFQGYEYYNQFLKVKSKIEYVIARFSLRKNRIKTGVAGTVVTISTEYKAEIGSLLETIRKIVNQDVNDDEKRDRIFKKISALQLEVDRDMTTLDALVSQAKDVCEVINDIAEKSDPLFNKLERLKKLIWDSPKKMDLLPNSGRQKLLPDQSDKSDVDVNDNINSSNDDVEIPF